MNAVLVNPSHPDIQHVSGARIPTFARLLARRGHRILLLTEALKGGAPSFPSVTAMRDALASHDWTQPFHVAVSPQERAMNRAIRRATTPVPIRKMFVATEFVRHNGVHFDWTLATAEYWDVITESFVPDVTWGTFGDTDALHVAREIGRCAGVPWGIDIKDAWHLFIPAGLRRFLARRFADANFVTANSLYNKSIAKSWFPLEATTVYSGAPDAAFESTEPAAQRTVVMMGSVYSPDAFAAFKVGLVGWLRRRTSKEPVRFVYAGGDEELVRQGCVDLEQLCEVETHRYLDLDVLMALCRGAMVNCYIVYPNCFHHKVIELLCCGRPVLCYPCANDEELDLARSVGADFSGCKSVSGVEAALQRAEAKLFEPRNTHDGLRSFRWEMQGLVLEDVLTQAVARCITTRAEQQ